MQNTKEPRGKGKHTSFSPSSTFPCPSSYWSSASIPSSPGDILTLSERVHFKSTQVRGVSSCHSQGAKRLLISCLWSLWRLGAPECFGVRGHPPGWYEHLDNYWEYSSVPLLTLTHGLTEITAGVFCAWPKPCIRMILSVKHRTFDLMHCHCDVETIVI